LVRRPGPGQRTQPGPQPQPPPDQAPALVPWEQLSDQARALQMKAVRGIPALLASVGFQVLRHSGGDHAGEADFTRAQWATLQQAMMASGVLVSIAEGVVDAEEIFALVKALRETSLTHPRPFIRELTAASTFNLGLAAGTKYPDFEGPALQAIRSATIIIARTAPAELAEFRALLIHLATVVAQANNEGGFFGLGARPCTPNEAAAIQAVSNATDLDRGTAAPTAQVRTGQPVPSGW